MTWQRRTGPALAALAQRTVAFRCAARLMASEHGPHTVTTLLSRMAAAGYACDVRTLHRHLAELVRDGILERDGHMYKLVRR